MIETLVTILHILTCLALILAILLQSGKGGGVSAAFGGGAGQALGQRSATTVLGRFTGIASTIFMVTNWLWPFTQPQSIATKPFAMYPPKQRSLRADDPGKSEKKAEGTEKSPTAATRTKSRRTKSRRTKPTHQKPTHQKPTHQKPTHQKPTHQKPTHQSRRTCQPIVFSTRLHISQIE